MAQRDTRCQMAFWVCRRFIGIADSQDIDWLKRIRQLKFFFYNVWLEETYPYRTQAKFRSFQHHVVCQNRSIDIRSFFAVKRTFPCLRMVGADKDR